MPVSILTDTVLQYILCVNFIILCENRQARRVITIMRYSIKTNGKKDKLYDHLFLANKIIFHHSDMGTRFIVGMCRCCATLNAYVVMG